MLIQGLNPGTIYRIKGKDTTWKYTLVLSRNTNKKEVMVLSPRKNIVKIEITDIPWIVKEMNLKFEII